MNIAEFVLWRARSSPSARAVTCSRETLTYAELSDRALQTVARLEGAGLSAGARIGIEGVRSCDYVAAICGILLSGSACVPLDPRYPIARLQHMISDAAPDLVFVEEAGESLISALAHETGTKTLEIGDSVSGPAGEPKKVGRADLAYLLYTSGTTGTPKGVEMTHEPLFALIDWHRTTSPFSRPGRCAMFAPVSFDVSFQEIFSTIAAGGDLVIVPEDTRRDLHALAGFLAEQRITRLFLPTVALAPLAECALASGLDFALEDIICAGEQLRISPAIANWYRAMNKCELHNHYGPTETHVVTTFTLAGDVDCWPTTIPLGAPLPHVTLELIGADGKPAQAEEPGEIILGGRCVGRGYRGLPDETRSRFVDSFRDMGRVYRTGDLACYRDGELYFLGRRDNQTKIDGVRVEPGELEAVLSAHPAVSHCVVAVRRSRAGGTQLVAYIVARVPDEGGNPRWLTYDPVLTPFVRDRLPPPLTPTWIAWLDQLPITPNGKIDRNALPAPPSSQAAPRLDHVAPSDELEDLIAIVWHELIGGPPPDRDANFFDLGGTSILAALARTRIAERAGLDISLVDLFAAPSIRSLARKISGPVIAVESKSTVAEDRRHRRNRLTSRAEMRRHARGLQRESKT